MGCDKLVNGLADTKMAALNSPVIDILPRGGPKRKRSFSEDAPDFALQGKHPGKRWKPDTTTASQHGEVLSHETDAAVQSSSLIREAIESQFSLEILLKHNELRLINQELAKCQVALEQLRRCHLIPYPTSQTSSRYMLDISNGVGPAVQRQGAGVPQWAPPYGVVDGPYTRHYARWLIPDPSFDGEQIQWYPDPSRAGKSLPEGRTTRHSFADSSTSASKVRGQRGPAGQKLQALSSGYPQPKEKAGPCVLKRSDGQTVKLVCIDCNRENFSSTQGFINHCRIAHRRDFKSHEEAAQQSGHVIEVDESGGIVGEEKVAAPVATGLVHPLIRSASTDEGAYKALLSRINASMALYHQGKLPGITSIPGTAQSTPCKQQSRRSVNTTPNSSFVPSSETPHLSALMRDRGFSSNLSDIVGEAKKVIDFDELSYGEDSEGEKPSTEVHRRLDTLDGTSNSPLPAMRVPARSAMSHAPFARPNSAKGLDAARKPGISPRQSYAAPVINTSAASYKFSGSHRDLHHLPDDVPDMMELDGPSLIDLSPNTVASNNAPSLVSDDGEYDDGDDDADSACEDGANDDSDVAEISIEDGDIEKVVSRNVSSGSKKEDKHVTFVSPVKEKGRARN